MAKDKNPIIGIYQITCIPTGKIYIGSAVNIRRRWSQHKHDLNYKKHTNSYLQHAWNKYGEECFRFNVLEVLEDTKILYETEESWIRLKNATDETVGFNMLDKCGKGQLGVKKSPETIEKQRQKLIGRKVPREQVEKSSAARRGKKRPGVLEKSWSTRRRLGKVRPPQEAIDKISKPVLGFNGQGELAHRFYSLAEAERAGYYCVERSIRKGHWTGGLIWCYESELENLDIKSFLESKIGKMKACTKMPYLDTETGIYYTSQKELAFALGLKTPTFNLQLKSGKHGNRYIKV